MAFDETLAGRIRDGIARHTGFVEKRMFGGIAFLWHGNLCVGVRNSSLIVRIDPQDYPAALTKPNVLPFDITGKPMRGWIVVDPEGTLEDAQLHAWIDRAMAFVATLPPK